jgi:uncharacterized protein (DUF302 family)
MTDFAYGFKKVVSGSLAEVEGHVREALASEGFGVLTEIDVSATLKKKLEVDFPPYRILGACDPAIAHQALMEEIDIGLLLPCNVVVYRGGHDGETVVSMLDPEKQLEITGREDIFELAADVRTRLRRVMDNL